MKTAIRLIVTLHLGILAPPLAANAQMPGNIPRIGVLAAGIPSTYTSRYEAFRRGLRELGYVEGQNITIEYRYAEGKLGRLPDLAAELVGLKVDVIVALAAPETGAAKRATTSIPIVFAAHGDPVGTGHVATKGLDWRATQQAARALGVALQSREVRGPEDFAGAFAAMTKQRPDALLTLPDPLLLNFLAATVAFAAKERLPAIYGPREYVEAGGFMAYEPDIADNYRRAAVYVHKVLQGAKPADLTVQQPTKFQLLINLKTAKALGLTIPQSVLRRADEVIE